MKRRLLISSSMLLMLAACSSTTVKEETTEKEANEVVEQVETSEAEEQKKLEQEKLQKELEQRKKAVYAKYYPILATLKRDFGIAVPDGKSKEVSFIGGNGVLYAELIDFNNDQIEELLVIYTEPEGWLYEFQVYSFIDGESKLIHEYDFDSGGRAEQTMISLVEDSEGAVHIKYRDYSSDENSFELVTFVNNEMVSNDYGYVEDGSYSAINGESVDPERVKSEVKKYKNNERFLVTSTGTKQFAIDISNPTQLINKVLDTLKANQNYSIMNKSNEISNIDNTDLSTMKETLNKIWFIDNLELTNKVKLIQEAYGYSLLNYESLESREYGDSYYMVIGENNLNEQLINLFGVDVKPNEVDEGPVSSENGQYGNVFYLEGDYYIAAAEFGGSTVLPIREVEKVVTIEEDLYYVEFNNYEFDTVSYSEATSDFEGNFITLSLDEWPESANSFVKRGYFGHNPSGTAILKKNSDQTFAVLYLSETGILTDDVIENIHIE